jgi:hypothetical protein
LKVVGRFFPCFKTQTDEIFIVANKQIFAILSKKLRKRAKFPTHIQSLVGRSTYFNGRLFFLVTKEKL